MAESIEDSVELEIVNAAVVLPVIDKTEIREDEQDKAWRRQVMNVLCSKIFTLMECSTFH